LKKCNRLETARGERDGRECFIAWEITPCTKTRNNLRPGFAYSGSNPEGSNIKKSQSRQGSYETRKPSALRER